MARYRPQKIRLSRVQGVSERLELIESNKAESAALDAKQDGIAFQEEGSALGGTGTVTEIDFTGAGVAASRVSNKLTVSISGGGGGGGIDTANSPNANEFARFTDADTIEGRTASEVKADLGLENVTNESKATMFTSAALTGTPTAPTAAGGTNSTQIASTAFVAAAIAAFINSAPGALDTLDELAAALGDDANFAATVTSALAGKQPLDADLTAIAALTTTAFGRSVLETADAAALRTVAALGTLATASPTGTPDGTKFLRDDLSWQATGSAGGGLTYPQTFSAAAMQI